MTEGDRPQSAEDANAPMDAAPEPFPAEYGANPGRGSDPDPTPSPEVCDR